MKKKMWLRFISMALVVITITATLAGCGSKVDEEGIEGQASAVSYNAEGRFTTTVTAEDAKFAENIKAEDITVNYWILDKEAYSNALTSEDNTEESEINMDDYLTEVKAQIQSVVRQDEKTLIISFTDSQAVSNLPDSYAVFVSKSKTGIGKTVGAAAEVAYPDHTLTPNLTSVSVHDKDIRLTLTLTEGEYAANVAKEQIELGGSFKNLNIDSLSAAGKNLTMQLTGEMSKNESVNAYLNGFVTIDRNAIVNGYRSASVSVPVDTVYFGLKLEQMTVTNGQVTVPVNIGGYRLTDKANASSFQIDDVSVSGFELVSDTSGIFTLSLPGVNDKNSAANTLNGKEITISADALGADEAVSFEADFNHADFYPVFDYAEEKDGKFIITLMLYANSGSFSENLKTDMVAFADDFANATVTSFTRENDSTAELVLSVDSNGVKVEDMDLTGTVTLKNGALVNRWGDVRSEECKQTRSYSQESMGKDLTDADIDIIKNIVGGFGNTTMGSLVAVSSGLVSAASGIYTALEIVGVIESQKAKLNKIYNAIQQVTKQLCDIQAAIEDQNAKNVANEIAAFYAKNLNPLMSSMQLAQAAIDDSKAKLKKDGINEPAQVLEYDDEGNCTSSKELQEEWKTYLGLIMNRVRENRAFEFNTLRERFEDVCGYLKTIKSVPGIIEKYDQHMAYYYNFESSAYADRENFRASIDAEISLAALLLCMYNQYGFEEPETAMINALNNMYEDAKSYIKANEVIRRTDKRTQMFIKGVSVRLSMQTELRTRHAFRSGKEELEFTDHEIQEFISRMNGRTIEEELTLAGIFFVPKSYAQPYLGVAFNCWGKNNGSWKFGDWRHYTNYYANIIRCGENKVSNGVYVASEDIDASWYQIYIWKDN